MENSTELLLLPQENISTSINHTMSETELPEDMKFNSGHVVSLVGYSTLFLVSSIGKIQCDNSKAPDLQHSLFLNFGPILLLVAYYPH